MRTIAEFLQTCVEEGAFPGAAWVVGNTAGVLESGAVGSLGEGLGPAREDTLYDLASLSKIIVTYALMRQFEEGLLRLEDEVGRFLPAYKGHEKGGITLLELLTHTSPFPWQTPHYRTARTREELLERVRWQPLRADAPARVQYSSEGYIVLGQVIEAIDGEALDKVLARRVLGPLAMRYTGFNPAPELLPRIAPTEYCPWRGRVVRGQVHDENAVVMGGVCGHTGLFGPAADVAAAIAMTLTGLAPDGEVFLRRATLNAMTHNYTRGKGEHRGLGFQLAGPDAPAGDLMGGDSYGHTGFTGTCMWADPQRSLYAVLLTNRIHPTRENTGIYRARHIFHNLAVLRYGS